MRCGVRSRVVRYDIVSSDTESGLSKQVNNLLSKDWKLHGSLNFQVCVERGIEFRIYAQAMVKHELIERR